MTAAAVSRALSGRRSGGEFVCRCPVPGHGKGRGDLNPSLTVRDGKFGLVVKCHAYCDSRDVLAELRRLGLLQSSTHRDDDAEPAHPQSDGQVSEERRMEWAVRAWEEAGDPRGTPADNYLLSRGLRIPADLAGEVIRFHPSLFWPVDGQARRVPALVAPFRSFGTNAITGIQRIALDDSGAFVDRRMLGVVRGSAIKLLAAEATPGALAICEGLETGLSCRVLGFDPVWVLGSVGHVAAFPAVPGVSTLSICRETDDGGESVAASLKCARRWWRAGAEVLFHTPVFAGDMDDVRAAYDRCRS